MPGSENSIAPTLVGESYRRNRYLATDEANSKSHDSKLTKSSFY